ncbi:MAG: hemolysin family protein [Coprobacillus sp.]
MDVDPTSTSIGLQFVIIGILILVNAYFAASEMAIVSINKTKIHHLSEQGNKKAKIVERLLKEPTSFLSTIQVAITLAGFFNSASAATGLSKVFGNVLIAWKIPFGESLAMIVITVLLSFVTLILGELVPKRIALQKAESIAMACAGPILFISKVLSPFIKLLSFSTSLVLRILGMKDENVEESLSREEIRMMVESGQENGVFNETETEMINSIFEFDDILAVHIMTPRTDVFCIDIDDSMSEYFDELMEMHYTRIPVYEESIDNIIGILHIKDFVVEAYKVGFENVEIRKLLRKPHFVLETKNIDELFKEMQKLHQHIAILVDEYGGFSGIVTTEDLIEEIMGEIEDEYDEQSEHGIQKIDNSSYLIDGNMDLDDINEELMIDLESENHETLSGFLLDLLGEIPEQGEERVIEWNNCIFKVIEVKDKRLHKIELIIKQAQEENKE